MSKLDTENSLFEPNGSFSESVSTTFVHDCSLTITILRFGLRDVILLFYCFTLSPEIIPKKTLLLTWGHDFREFYSPSLIIKPALLDQFVVG